MTPPQDHTPLSDGGSGQPPPTGIRNRRADRPTTTRPRPSVSPLDDRRANGAGRTDPDSRGAGTNTATREIDRSAPAVILEPSEDRREATLRTEPVVTVPAPPEDLKGIKKILYELRPSVVTGGAPALPLVVLAALEMVDGLDIAAWAVLSPEIRDYFGVSLFQLNTITSLASFLGIALSLPMGYFSDRWNRIMMTAAGSLLVGVMALFTGFAWSFTALIVFRFGARLGRIVAPAQNSLLADYYPAEVRASVFSFNTLGNRVGSFIAPLVAGTLGSLFFWQVPFVVLAIPGIVVSIVLLLKLREPVRGEQERRAMGATEAEAMVGEAPPSWTESWRIAKGVRTIRKLWMAIPFLVGAAPLLSQFRNQYYADVFGLGPAARGAIGAFDEPVAIAGLLVGGVISNRLLRYRPGRAITYSGFVSVFSGISFAMVAISPWLWLAIVFDYAGDFFRAILIPAILALLSMVIPPRVRGFALSTFAIFAIPGLLLGPIFGGLGDSLGLRAAILLLTPVYMLGAVFIMSAGSSVEADIRAARAAAMAALVSRESKAAGKAKLLVVRDLDVKYDAVQILFNVDFEVDEGEIVALLGTNGAGKSTLLRAISGTTVPSNGAIFFDGEDITFLPPSAHAAKGIIQVPGGRGVFPTLTVAENLKLAAWLYRSDDQYVRTATASVLERFPALGVRLNEAAGNLSGGEQQMLTLGQAFLSKPRLLMIDELSLGLAPAIVEQLLDIVRAIAASGTTIILVEQSVNVALTVARRAVYMEKGEIKFSGPTADLMARPDILRSVYLKGAGGGGGPLVTYGRNRYGGPTTDTEPANALEVIGVKKTYGGIQAIPGVDLTLEEGKIVGLIGPNGAGKTTLFDIISGFVTPDDGRILMFGEDVTDLPPDQRAKLGLTRSFQDARLFPSLTVTENIALALEKHLQSKSTIAAALHLPGVRKSERSIERRIDRLIRLMSLQDFRDKFVSELSTGSRRIVDLACVMACDPKLLLLDEPSSGIAQREAEELGPLLHRIKWETGCSVLIIEHDMTLITSISDELVALDLGMVVARGRPTDVLEHPMVVASYLGTSEEVINRSGELGS